jgi:lysophospholipase L1-like esterase
MAETLANPAVVPLPKIEDDFYDWYARHELKTQLAVAGHYDLIFIGDSITHLFEGDANWPGRGEKVWAEFYGRRKALNLGYGWDRTQNVLWRLAHGEFSNQRPRLVVLLIGTNNLSETPNHRAISPACIAEGIRAVCDQIWNISPATHILLMGVLPRDVAQSPHRESVRQINRHLEHFAAGRPQTTFLDIGQRFLSPDGDIQRDLMDDLVHPTESGHRLWAAAIEPLVRHHLGEDL